MRRGHSEPASAVHPPGTLRLAASGGQPVSTACAPQPAGLQPPGLPTCMEHGAVGRGKWAVASRQGLGPLAGTKGPSVCSVCSAPGPVARAGGRGPWSARAPTPQPAPSCCPKPCAWQSPSPGHTRPACSSAATNTRSCSGWCPPGPRWVTLGTVSGALPPATPSSLLATPEFLVPMPQFHPTL